MTRTEQMDRAYSRCVETNFATMSEEQFGIWVDRLPLDEFFGLIALHDEHRHSGRSVAHTVVKLPPLPPNYTWIVYTGDGELPLAPDTHCVVLFPDGETAGPNRADAFLWGGDGSAQILAYALDPTP